MNKIIFIIFLTLFTKQGLADLYKFEYKSLEFSSAFLTHHYSKLNADRFENKVSTDGRTINNPLYALTLTYSDNQEFYKSISIFSGKDSIDSPMQGFMLSGGIGDMTSNTVQIGWIWGMYFYDENAWAQKFSDREEKTPSWLYAYYGEEWRGINMIFGLEVNFKFDITDKYFIKFRNNFTPMISNHSLSIGFEF